MRRQAVAFLCLLSCLMVTSVASAYVLTSHPWASGEEPFNVYVDTGSFSNLNGDSLSSTESTYWVGWALKEWKVRSGADFDYNVFTTTNASCRTSGDNYNVVGVSSSSASATCGSASALACHIARNNVWGNRIEDDICVVGNAATWEVVQEQIASGNKDLIGVLVHEVGHFLGMEHTSYPSVMKSNAFFSSAGRHLYGNDIEGVRDLFGGGVQVFERSWRTWYGTSETIGSATSFGGTTSWQRPAAGIGGSSAHSTNRYVVSNMLNTAGTLQYFNRASYPISGSWSSPSVSTNSWTTAGLASNDGVGSSAKWVAFWPSKQYDIDDTCEFKGGMSTNAFQTSYTAVTISGACSQLPPAIAWDPNSSRFVMVWKAMTGDYYNTGKIYATTSTNGTSWTTPQSLGVHTLDAPSIACHSTLGCMIGYVRGSSEYPTVVTRKITVSSGTGSITNGSWTEGLSGVQHMAAIGPYNLPDGAGNQFLTLSQLPSGTQRAQGSGYLWSTTDDANPVSHSWSYEGIFLEHPAAYAGRRTSDWGYIITD